MTPAASSAPGSLLQIGDVASQTGLSIKTIRHYDDAGLVVPSARSAGGFRLYTDNDIARLMTIRRMKPLGFTLDEMRELIEAIDVLDTETGDVVTAARLIADYHRRALDACAGLRVQLDYATELTDQLAARAGAKTTD